MELFGATQPPHRALLLVDLQRDFFPGGALPCPGADTIIGPINAAAPLFHTVAYSVDCKRASDDFGAWAPHCVEGTAGYELHPGLRLPPGALGPFKKTRSMSAFGKPGAEDTGLLAALRGRGITEVVVAGVALEFCVIASALGAADAGFSVALVREACAAMVPAEPRARLLLNPPPLLCTFADVGRGFPTPAPAPPGGRLTAGALLRDLRSLGVREGEILIVHSSYKALGGPVEGGAGGVIAALQAAVGGAGTLLLPAFTHPLPEVSALETPTRLGYIPEAFRVTPGVRVSNNHTHRVAAWGRLAAELVAVHEGAAPLGRGSPMHEAARRGARVLLLGVGFTSCSLIHVAESLCALPFAAAQVCYPGGFDKPIALTRTDGARVVCPPVDNPGDSAAFGAVGAALERAGLLARGRVGAAEATLARGNDVLCAAVDLLAGDPLALLCVDAACSVCVAKRAAAARARS
jgi:aminoglycoside 3-N-acetyltransferase